jgi:hypothetical protein
MAMQNKRISQSSIAGAELKWADNNGRNRKVEKFNLAEFQKQLHNKFKGHLKAYSFRAFGCLLK